MVKCIIPHDNGITDPIADFCSQWTEEGLLLTHLKYVGTPTFGVGTLSLANPGSATVINWSSPE